MKKYHYFDGNEQHGPFTIEELKSFRITKETLVWYDGLADWQPAGSVNELEVLFGAAPIKKEPAKTAIQEAMQEKSEPVMQKRQEETNVSGRPEKPKNWIVEAVIVTILCCSPLALVSIFFGSRVNPRYERGDYEGAASASKTAKLLVFVSLALGIIFYIIAAILGESPE